MPHKPPDKLLQAVKLKHDNPSITLAQLAQLTGTTPQNIHQSFKRHKVDWKKTHSYKELEADILAGYKERILSRGITDDKIDKANLRDIAITVGILDDKEDRKRNKTAIRDLMSDVIERLAKQRRTTIIIDQSDNNLDINIDNAVDKLDNNIDKISINSIDTDYTVDN
jgi:hypothetical protein